MNNSLPHRILLVQQTDAIQAQLVASLEQLGMDVVSIADCALAMPSFREEDIDIVMIDIDFPEDRGIDLLGKWPQTRANYLLSAFLAARVWPTSWRQCAMVQATT